MGGKSKPTIGYRYHVAYHAGLCVGPIDAFLEFRAGDRTAWSGELTSSGTITINQPKLFGGDKDQGGIVGDVDVMFGEATQQPNSYLLSTFGTQVPAWRGLTTLAFKGGEYGAMNPYPQKPAYKVRRIIDWDGETCWYSDKAQITVTAAGALAPGSTGWDYQTEEFAEPNTVWNVFIIPTSGWLSGGVMPFGTGQSQWPQMRSNLWVRKTVTVTGVNQVLCCAADNGCALFVNGALVGYSNPQNTPIDDNSRFPVKFHLQNGKTYEVVAKAYAEVNATDDIGNSLSIWIEAMPVIAMNPAHILYYARTHAAMGRAPVAAMNDASFRAGADWFYSNVFGLCTEYDPSQESTDDFIKRVETVAACAVSRSPVDGQYYLDIANGIYDFDSLPILTDDDILEFSESPRVPDGSANSVSVQYFDPVAKRQVTTPPVQAMALVDAFGTIEQVSQYPEIPTAGIATRVAQRDLRSSATPTRAFEITCTRKPYAWRVNQYFRLQSVKRGIADMVCILSEKSTGTLRSGAIKITAAQDIYSLPATSFVSVETGVDTAPPIAPAAIAAQMAFEAPYTSIVGAMSRADLAALPDDVGYLMTVAQAPDDYLGYTITVSTDGGTTYNDVADASWTPCARIIEGDALQDAAPATTFTLSNGSLLSAVPVGAAAVWGAEMCRVDAINASANPPTLTLGRGCADTVPVAHAAGEEIFFYGVAAGADTDEFTSGETLDAKLLTNASSGQLDPTLAPVLAVTFDGRQARPYPPGRLQINGAWYPSVVSSDVDLSIGWAHRDRLTQADQLLDTTASSTGPEAGCTYNVTLFDDNDIAVKTATGISGTSFVYDDELTPIEDPLWSDVASLADFEGTDGATTYTDAQGNGWTMTAGAAIDTDAPIFGTGSLNIPLHTYCRSDAAIFAPAGGSHAIEVFVRPAQSSGFIFDMRPGSSTNGNWPGVVFDSTNLALYINGANRILVPHNGAVAPGVRAHIEVDFDSGTGTWYLFLNGTPCGTYAGAVSSTATRVTLGVSAYSLTSSYYAGVIDNLRLTLGATRHTSSFPAPTIPAAQYLQAGMRKPLLRAELLSVRDTLDSWTKHNVTVRRGGYGFNYGYAYGGSA